VPTRFERDTTVRRLDDETFGARLDRGWWVDDRRAHTYGPNGGYVASIILRALSAAVDDPARAPRSLNVHYATPPTEGEVTVRPVIERRGKHATLCSARVYQEDRLVALAVASFSTPRPGGPEFCDLVPPDAPAPETVERVVVRPDGPPVRKRWDMRWTIGRAPNRDEQQAPREALAGGWIRLDEPQVLDAPAVAALMDAWTPPVYLRAGTLLAVPTVNLSIHFRTSLPLPGATPDDFLLAIFRTNAASEGFIEEDGEVWSADGRLVAQSRQLATLVSLADRA
jgi:acyl-CoA thioesterase